MKVEELLELVSNPEKYKKALAELDSRKKAIDEALGKQADLSKTQELKAKAEKELENARQKAAQIVEEAVTAAAKAKAAVSEAADKLSQREELAVKKASLAEAEIKHAKEMTVEAEKVRKEYQKKYDELVAKLDEVHNKGLELEARLSKIRSIMA
jgi:chromosome segregation ATPase